MSNDSKLSLVGADEHLNIQSDDEWLHSYNGDQGNAGSTVPANDSSNRQSGHGANTGSAEALIHLPVDPAVPAGKYALLCVDHELNVDFYEENRMKLRYDFEVCNGKYQGRRLKRYYNIPVDENGEYSLGDRSAFLREMIAVFGSHVDIGFSHLVGKKVVAIVGDQTKDKERRNIKKHLRTPIVKQLVRMAK